MSKSYHAADHKAWEQAGLEQVMTRHEMTYVNQEDDGADSGRGEWFMADDKTRTIIYGTFGNDHSPGAWHYTNADVYENEDEYRAELARWEAMPEYLDMDEYEEEDPDEEADQDDNQ